MTWCEENRVEYVLALASNKRLKRAIEGELESAKRQWKETREAARIYKELRYRTLKSWSRERRVLNKAEHLAQGSRPRFIVTSFSQEELEAETLWEFYCACGDMENRTKEKQMEMFADRTST